MDCKERAARSIPMNQGRRWRVVRNRKCIPISMPSRKVSTFIMPTICLTNYDLLLANNSFLSAAGSSRSSPRDLQNTHTGTPFVDTNLPQNKKKLKSHLADPVDIMLSLFSLLRSLICPSMSPATPSSRFKLSAWDIDCFCWGEAAREESERERRSSPPPPSTSSTSWEKMRTLLNVRFF